MKVYFISGLGADRRVFRNIRLAADLEPVYLDWIPPQENESLAAYARRMAGKIETGDPFSLIGLSMGGMIAAEICKICRPQCTILISSVPLASEIPFYIRWTGRLSLRRAILPRLIKSSVIINRFLDIRFPEERAMILEMIESVDDQFISWAIGAIARWDNEVLPAAYLHIHGAKDRVLPIRYTHPTHAIPGADHFMVMTRAEEINDILDHYIQVPQK
jgi:pimeloyl-ACP methyl ester carboxylesterase